MSDQNSAPMFSIITITYNDLVGLERTVKSVAEQTETSFEHMIIDGSSEDGTVEWLESLPSVSWRTWTSEPDEGIYDAMNKGLRGASGNLVIMLNSGDSFSDATSLAVIRESYEAHGWDWSYGAIRLVSRAGEVRGAYTFDPFNKRKFVMGIAWIPHASVVMRRSTCEAVGEYRLDLGSFADQEYLMRLLNVSGPHVITWFLCDFESGGISSSVGPREREKAWHRMRYLSENLWMQSRILDLILSEILALRKPLRIAAKRFGDMPSRRNINGVR